jgi:hypothetical protein
MVTSINSPRTKQDPAIKGNPWMAEPTGVEGEYLVRSASDDRRYPVDILTSSCRCDAWGLCWHLRAAELRQAIDVEQRKCRAMYASYTLAELQAEDARLRAELEALDTHLLRAQYDVVGELIADYLEPVAA